MRISKPFDFNKAMAGLAEKAKLAQADSKAQAEAKLDNIIASVNAEPQARASAEALTAKAKLGTLTSSNPKTLLNNLAIIESARLGVDAAPECAEPRGIVSTSESTTTKLAEDSEPANYSAITPSSENVDTNKPNSPATFEWDESQLQAIESILKNRYSCLIGAAGSGKTTVVKEIVRRLESMGVIQPLAYQRCNGQARNVYNISFVSFTGKAVEQLRKSIPPHLQCCCETIHSLLEYAPVVIDKVVEVDGHKEVKGSRIFLPRRDEFNKLPQSIIVIDESGMVGVDLWNNLFKALDKTNPNLKIILIGDINQLPAVIGKSILGYALNSPRWTTNTLTKIHRQALDNPIIANAHAIKDGQQPHASEPLGNTMRKFNLINIGSLTPAEREGVRSGKLNRNLYDIKNRASTALNIVVKMIAKLYACGEYDPDVDQIIVPQNVGMLGQESLNGKLAQVFNSANRRHAIRASYETRFLAIGDKVMFTKNDYGLGILNGMTGYIKNISLNTAYADYALVKAAEENGMATMQDAVKVNEDSMSFAEQAFADINKLAEEKEDNPTLTAELEASHIVVVEYTPLGSDEPQEIALSKVGQIRGLLLAYAITCHKAQGSEYRKVIVITHSSNSQMLSREWLYTAVTRARENLLLLYNEYANRGLSTALRRQIVKGETIEEKAANFSLAEATKESNNLQQGLIPLGIFDSNEVEAQATEEAAQ
jgi:exodeoxyribonuclease V alpha subunit